MKYCVLEEGKECTNCGECEVCDLDPNKICDNCCKCIDGAERNYSKLKLSDFFSRMEAKWAAEAEDDHFEDCNFEPTINVDTKVIVRYKGNIRGIRKISQ